MSDISLDLGLSTNSREPDFSQLLAHNKALESELAQCQADKDFVWSLWKKLQVSNPDVTEAVSLVVQREKEKSEAKDRKVLEILQIKDDRIEELQNIVAKQAQEIGDVLTKKVEWQEQTSQLQAEKEHLKNRISNLDLQVKSLEGREKSVEDINRRSQESFEREKHEMQRRVTELTTELEVARTEKTDNLAKRIDLENKIGRLEHEISEKVARFDGLVRDLDAARRQVQEFRHLAEHKNSELEAVRKELSDLWNSHRQLTDHSSQQAELIHQLQGLQQETQRMLKNQEDAYSLETTSMQQMYSDVSVRYDAIKHTETELRQQVLQLKKELMERDDEIAQLRGTLEQREDLGGSYLDTDRVEPVVDLEFKVRSLEREIRILQEKLREKDRLLAELERGQEDAGDPLSSRSGGSRAHSSPSSSPRPSRHSRSYSGRGPVDLHRQLASTSRRLEDAEHLLDLKSRELEELRKAHAQRLERLKSLQASYRLVKEQLKTFEEDNPGRRRQLQRADPRDLQREDSDAVWNELAYFKNENRNLEVEKMSMQEELDTLRVQATEDAASIHELRAALEEARQDLDYQMRRSGEERKDLGETTTEVAMLKAKIHSKEKALETMEAGVRQITAEKETLIHEKRELKQRMLAVQEDNAQQRMVIADLKTELQRLRRERRDAASVQATSDEEADRKSRRRPTGLFHLQSRVGKKLQDKNLARRYQKALNKSIEKMTVMFDHFNEEGWEPISDSLETEEETEVTESDTLGQAIVNASQNITMPLTSDTDTSTLHGGRRVKVQARPGKFRGGRAAVSTRQRGASTRQPKPAVKAKVKTSSSSSSTSPALASANTGTSPGTIQRIVLRETATSPIPPGSPRAERLARSGGKGRAPRTHQLGPLKQRVSQLQQQVSTLRESRGQALKTVSEMKEANSQLQAELTQVSQRLRNSRQSQQKLLADLERLQREKAEVDTQLTAAKEQSNHSLTSGLERRTEQDFRALEARIKVSSGEITRQASMIRNLRADNESLTDQVKSLQDKLNHAERDNNQKRTLVENLRSKFKQVQESAKTDGDRIEGLETRVKLLSESNDKMKTQMESLKKRVKTLTSEKNELEDKHRKTLTELEKKARQVVEGGARREELEAALGTLEDTAQQQLHELAAQSEAAIDAAQHKLSAAHRSLQQYAHFTKTLAKELQGRVERARSKVRELQAAKATPPKTVDASLQRAQDVAKNILNLSQSDLEDIMSADGDKTLTPDSTAEVERKQDKKWMRACEKLQQGKEEFAMPLVNLFLQKVDERLGLMEAVQR